MPDTETPRGRTLTGAREVAGYVWDDEEKWRSVYLLPRDEFGLIELNGKITGFSGWIDAALAARARTGKKRRYRAHQTSAELTA
jgi:hypothetical protein